MEYLPPFIILFALIITSYLWYSRSRNNKKIKELQNQAVTFEDKMLILKSQSNKTLKSIDYTLDWFFWVMILGFVFYIFNLFLTSTYQTFI